MHASEYLDAQVLTCVEIRSSFNRVLIVFPSSGMTSTKVKLILQRPPTFAYAQLTGTPIIQHFLLPATLAKEKLITLAGSLAAFGDSMVEAHRRGSIHKDPVASSFCYDFNFAVYHL